MTINDYIYDLLRVLETWRPGSIAFAYYQAHVSNPFYTVAINDIDYYLTDKRFKAFRKAWGDKADRDYGRKVIFVAREATEAILIDLYEKDNLIMRT